MGTFVKDRNINTGNVGNQGSSVQGGKVSSSNVNFSEITRGDASISSGGGMSNSVDFGELFSNTPTKESSVSAQGLSANQTHVADSSQAGTTASSSDLSNDRQHDEQVNVNSGTATKNSTTKSDSTNVSTGPSVSGTAAPASGNSGGGVSGGGGSSSSGSASGSSMSAGGNSAAGTGETGAASGGTGVSVQTSSMSNSSTTVVNSGGNVSVTGAEVSVQTSSMSSAVPASNINSAYSNTGAVSGSGLYFIAETMDFLRSLADTVAVIAASAVAAVANIGEGIKDGLGYLVAAVLDLFGQDDAANNLRIDIARDDIGEFEKWLFEKGPGKGINDRSWIKYDSALAKGITSFAEVAVVIAAAAAIEVITGGMATPVLLPLIFGGFGLAKGLGEASERAYQNAIANGQYDLTLGFLDNLKIVAQGGMEALAWVFNAKAGAGIGQMMIAAQADGWSAVANVVKNDFLSEKNIKAMFSKGNVVMNLFGSVMQSSPQLMKVIGEIKSGEVKAGDVALLVVEIAGYFGLNTLTDGLRNVTSGFISDRKAKFLADELLNGNKGANLGKYLSEYNDSSVQRILINMTGEDVYKNLNSVNADDIAKVVSMLDDAQKGDFAVIASMDLFKEGSIVSLDDLAKYGDEMQADIIDQLAYRVLNSDDSLSSDDLRKMCDDDLYKKIDLRVYDNKVASLYDEGMAAAREKYNAFFKNFREHAGAHTKLVRDYAVDLAKKAGFSEEDIATIKYSAECHDLGMKGGVFKVTQKDLEDLGLSPEQAEKFFDDYTKSGRQYLTLDPDELQTTFKKILGEDVEIAIKEFDLANIVRKNHPLNSALIILEEGTVPEGVDVQVAALLAMTHSKSTSGISSFDDPEMWHDCINKLEEAMKDCGNGDLIDADALRRMVDNEEDFLKLKDAALCIRDGDAMSELALTYKLSEDGDTIMQTGEFVHTDSSATRLSLDETPEKYEITQERLQEIRQKIIDKARKKGKELTEEQLDKLMDEAIQKEYADMEASLIVDAVYNADGSRKVVDGKEVDVDNLMSRRIHAGEKNVSFSSEYIPDGSQRSYEAVARINDPELCPMSTMDAIEERAGEVITYTNCEGRTYTIEVSVPEDSNLGKWYQSRVDSFKTNKLEELLSSRQSRLVERINKKLGSDDKFSIPNGVALRDAIDAYISKHPEAKADIMKEYGAYLDYAESIAAFLRDGLKIKFV